MRAAIPILILSLAACVSEVPDSGFSVAVETGAGVGFGDPGRYAAERSARRAALAQGGSVPVTPVLPAGAPTSSTALPSSTPGTRPVTGGAPTAGLDPSIIAAVEGAGAPQAAAPVVPADPATPIRNSGISDEQDFGAVAARRDIEDDAARVAQTRQRRVEIAPTALPERPNSTGPNIVSYALQTTNDVGQPAYRRSLFGQGRFERNCARYASADAAQTAFLASGGPQRDRQGLDPDGDGFACAWDPAPFRRAAGR